MQPVNWPNGAVYFTGRADDDEFNDSSSEINSPRSPRSNYSSPSRSNPGSNASSANSTPTKRGKRGRQEENSPVKTPAKVKGLEQIIRKRDMQADLTAQDSKRLLEGVDALPSTKDSPRHQKLDAVAKRVATESVKKLLELGDDEELDLSSTQTHVALSAALEESPWVGTVLRAASQAHESAVHKAPGEMLRIFNWQHITSQQNGRGMHFLPRNHPDLRLIANPVFNSAGIFCGTLHNKFSTFFPILDTEEELLEILNNAKTICKYENRQLHITYGKDKTPFYVESFIKHGVKHHSSFPLFFFSKWQQGSEYQIIPNQAPLTSETLYSAAKFLGFKGIRYITEDSIIIDIAQGLPSATDIQQGIYIEFPCQLFPEFDFE